MSNFEIAVGHPGKYNLLDSNVTIPVRVKWGERSICLHMDADAYDRDELLARSWPEIAREVAELVAAHLYHGDEATAVDFISWLDDDQEDEHLVEIETAEEEWRLPRITQAIGAQMQLVGSAAAAGAALAAINQNPRIKREFMRLIGDDSE